MWKHGCDRLEAFGRHRCSCIYNKCNRWVLFFSPVLCKKRLCFFSAEYFMRFAFGKSCKRCILVSIINEMWQMRNVRNCIVIAVWTFFEISQRMKFEMPQCVQVHAWSRNGTDEIEPCCVTLVHLSVAHVQSEAGTNLIWTDLKCSTVLFVSIEEVFIFSESTLKEHCKKNHQSCGVSLLFSWCRTPDGFALIRSAEHCRTLRTKKMLHLDQKKMNVKFLFD